MKPMKYVHFFNYRNKENKIKKKNPLNQRKTLLIQCNSHLQFSWTLSFLQIQ